MTEIPKLFSWDVVTGRGVAQQTRAGGVNDCEHKAVACLDQSLREVPEGDEAWGHVTRVELQMYMEGMRSVYRPVAHIVYARRSPDGEIEWVTGEEVERGAPRRAGSAGHESEEISM